MRIMFLCIAVSTAACLLSVGCSNKAALDEYLTQEVTFPNGTVIRAETMTKPEDMMRGMMFRDSLAPDRGMLFVHGEPGLFPYWMYQVRIPLDIVWMDLDRRIVEISADTPPCKTEASKCPTYGGHQKAVFVLELAGGMAKKYGLYVGDKLSF